ncbi:PREDICTED: SET and MYND domain-containing protein 4-like [Dinoponera quadriceps]|uniref:Protein-lysine N-methyltransferase SMYD4 n=1 Tax=Dinoponera quadriceps TaxID=609295 RepID=A0A6P3Y6K3_DINQU|nr:PREDICTED: SET and MYND domain-containing protein 4-like [Dinoponera quadriceps]XP_014486635.1 PREDICTED: SET and MYND domain-containing protein 4-like [Dinoponera quadriceps]XP_014486636.1 PREDICTED: SET and MYND domain-containing protein 4-like [Dinoponera quadriceps]
MAYHRDKLVFALLKADKYFDVMDSFQKLKTDQERVIYTLNIMWENGLIPDAINKTKNAKDSEQLREEGNNIYVTCNSNDVSCVIALNLYTKSISMAPYLSLELALAYGNRSAVLYVLGLYLECIQDIDRALALNYPDDLKGKLFIRKMQCLIALGKPIAEDMIKETEHWISEMTMNPNKLKIQAKLDGLRRKIEQGNIQSSPIRSEESESEFPLPVIKSCNNEIPCASDAVVLKYDKQFGRHVVAARNIDAGEVLVVEKPYSLLLTQQKRLTHCSNCLKVCWATIPCKNCTYTLYCSEQCRDIEWRKYHDVECDIFTIMVLCGFCDSDFLSLRLAVLAVKEAGNIKRLRTMLKKIDESDDPRTMGFSSDGKFYSDKYISLYSLERSTEERPFPDLFQRSVDTCYILYHLAKSTQFFGIQLSNNLKILAKNDDVTFIGGLILRHQQIIPTNVHSFCEEQNLNMIERGMAAMPFCSLFNHSCSPNIIRSARPEHIILYALYPIRSGEQLLDNYGYLYALMPKIERQESLLKSYFFTCKCIPCQENWPMLFEFESYETLAKTTKDKKVIKNALRKFNIYVDLARKGDVMDKPYIIEDLLMMIRVMYKRVPVACKEMGDVVETLKRVHALYGNRFILPKIQKRDM